MTRNSTNTAIRRSLERGFDASVNPATKAARVVSCEAFALADFPQTAPHEIATVITEAISVRVRRTRVNYFAGATLSNIRRDIEKFVKDVQGNTLTVKQQRDGVRALMGKHGKKLIQFPSLEGDEMWVKRLENIKVSREQDTEWDRAIKLRHDRIDDSQSAVRVMEDFGKIAVNLVNGAPTEFSQI